MGHHPAHRDRHLAAGALPFYPWMLNGHISLSALKAGKQFGVV